DQEGKIDIFSGRPMTFGVGGQSRHLIIENELGVVEQAADQGRFAVVHRTAGQEPQQVLGPRRLGRAPWRRVHQKYPSRFFFSIDAASSLSIKRPCRSDTRVWSISATMSSIVSAFDSIAPVKG